MSSPSHICPECGMPALKCRRTQPDYASARHELEMARQSLWFCRACGAVFALSTPSGMLARVGENNAGKGTCAHACRARGGGSG